MNYTKTATGAVVGVLALVVFWCAVQMGKVNQAEQEDRTALEHRQIEKTLKQFGVKEIQNWQNEVEHASTPVLVWYVPTLRDEYVRQGRIVCLVLECWSGKIKTLQNTSQGGYPVTKDGVRIALHLQQLNSVILESWTVQTFPGFAEIDHAIEFSF